MLSSKDVQQYSLTKVGKGYKISEVDDLLDEVAATLKNFEKEVADSKKQIELLTSKIKEYRQNEDSIRAALVTAQCAADKILREAKERKESVDNETNQKAQAVFEASKEKSKALLTMAKSKAEELISEGQNKHDELIAEANHIAETLISKVKDECAVEARRLEEIKKRNVAFRKSIAQQYCDQFEMLKSTNFDYTDVPVEEVNESDVVKTVEAVENNIRSSYNAAKTEEPVVKTSKEIPEESADEFLEKAAKESEVKPQKQEPVEDLYGNATADDSYTETKQSADEPKEENTLNNMFDVYDETDNDGKEDFAKNLEKKAKDNDRFGETGNNGFGIFHKK